MAMYIRLSLVDNPLLNHGHKYRVAHTVTFSTLLGRFSTKVWTVLVRILANSTKRAFMRSGTNVGWENLACN